MTQEDKEPIDNILYAAACGIKNTKIMTQEEIKKYLKENLKLSWEHKNGNYYIVLKFDDEKVTELNFGEGISMTTEEKAKAYDEALKIARCWLNDPQTIQDCNYTIEDAIQNIFPVLAKSENENAAKLCSNEWSEEDEGELQNAIDALEFLGKKGVYKSESGYDAALQAASWLKNIPERFNLQPKQEWSEEDKDAISGAIGILLDDNNPNFVFPEHSKLSVGEIIKRLKSLRPHWKPSEE